MQLLRLLPALLLAAAVEATSEQYGVSWESVATSPPTRPGIRSVSDVMGTVREVGVGVRAVPHQSHCNILVSNRGAYFLRISYTDLPYLINSTLLSYGEGTNIKASIGSTVQLKALAGRATACVLNSQTCVRNWMQIECTGTTFWGFHCDCQAQLIPRHRLAGLNHDFGL